MKPIWLASLSFLLVCGCDRPLAVVAPAQTSGKTQISTFLPDDMSNSPRFSVRGKVIWKGEPPVVPKLPAIFGKVEKHIPPFNPFFPRIDEKTKGLANAVVSIDLSERGRPELQPKNLTLIAEPNRFYFEPGRQPIVATTLGSELEMKSVSDKPSIITARGAAFYSLTFPTPETVHRKKLEQAGQVNFYNSGGEFSQRYCWAGCRAYVFDHPWFAVTDDQGNFEIKNIPLGKHEIVVDVADYRMEKYEQDPDTQLITRILYKSPVQKLTKISVNRNQEVQFEVGNGDFR
ncbi:hypothetical protein KIH39_01555 [Telmatocola sphagniphila]|uniref:Uncharacterized protein n=1 Tax=Telmatocola sphagniphila TaxID=1123043 RepID=A0A8E6B7M1_9BACT|nr:hypothetical protein [Telmatocola sphagniphila]QVL32631.1 hypothetical protein KIH39_01555 [Telmatocola sphagniphila]